MTAAPELAAIQAGDKRAIAAALARIEQKPDEAATLAMLDAAWAAARAHVVGITGPPGVGKSSLSAVLIRAWRGAGESVGVIAVDPSSQASGGALLGDRLRLAMEPDSGLFIRSMAARDRLGGLAAETVAAMAVLRAAYGRVLIETVGVGQSETDIAIAADTVLLCLQPGSGDTVQFMKAGIVEIPDLVVVTKSDLGAIAGRSLREAQSALGLAQPADWAPPILAVSATTGAGVDELHAALEAHQRWLASEGRLQRRRADQERRWLDAALRERFGSDGLKRLGTTAADPTRSPFAQFAELEHRLKQPR